MNKFIILFIAFCFFSCQKKEQNTTENNTSCKKEKKFEMYELSEMASLMEQMYVYNLQIKNKIEKGESVGEYPEFFNKIYTAKFTDSSDKDQFFDEKAKAFIAAQNLIYLDPKNVKQNFNNVVTACITCHQGKCGGPIPKIKKLYLH
jgi:cytochrome c556